MSEALAKVFSDEERLNLALALTLSIDQRQIGTRLEDVALELQTSPGDLALLLNDPSFLKLVRSFSRAQAILSLHRRGIPELAKIMEKGQPTEIISAVKVLGQLTGDLRSDRQIDVRITFDDLRKGATQRPDDPLGSLFDIRPNVVDAEVEE